MKRHRIAIVGLGKIATDQHVPSITANPAFELTAVVSARGATVAGLPSYADLPALFEAQPAIEVLALCTPPAGRFALTRAALQAGRHVLIEKPPAATLGEITELARIADAHGRVLFATWHSRFNAAVEEARRRLAGRHVRRLLVDWREDVRRWHPGQAWIWQSGGFGVFDPGINALSIVTEILPEPIFVASARLEVPANRQMPIGASLAFTSPDPQAGDDLGAVFDWRKQGEQSWTILVETADGERLRLTDGGARLFADDVLVTGEASQEYPNIYRRFAELLAGGRSDVDVRPLRLVADAFLVGERSLVDRFDD